MKIGFIGTGVMGYPMITHLIKAGHELNVYNRSIEKTKCLELIASVKKSIKDTVSNVDVVFTIVGFPKDVQDVYQEVFLHAKPNTILVDMTTSSPSLAKNLSIEAIKKGFILLDAPVTGGDLGAKNQTLSIMVGGNHQAFLQVKPLLEILGKTITYMGEAGAGQHMKLANQITIAGNIAAIAEGLTYAKQQGLSLESAHQVISNGSASSWQAINNGIKMINSDFKPGFYVKHFLKDLNLAIEESKGMNLPVLHIVRDIYDKLSNEYYDAGTQAIIAYYLMTNA